MLRNVEILKCKTFEMNNIFDYKRVVCFLVGVIVNVNVLPAQDFDRYFENRTLRLDYIFSGNRDRQNISVDQLNSIPGWYGKRKRLSELPVEGNGQITVRTHGDSTIIYRQSFSTLFQEWLSYDESKTNTRAFENVFIVPFPKDTVDITIDLRNNRHEITATLTHTVCPGDILIRRIGEQNVTPYETLLKAKDSLHSVHIAYIAEGYTEEQMGDFIKDAKTANEALFQHEPFKTLKKDFNIIAVKAPSRDSGTSIPSQGIWKNTALSSHFNTFYMDRYLTTLHLKDLHNLLAGTPYEHIIVLVNTEHYGGGGILNSYNLSMTKHQLFKPVVVHEFGHSFAGLGDEYAYENEQIPMYPHDVEPWEPNLTTLVDFGSKWMDMINDNVNANHKGPNLYEGAGYSLKGIYRPEPDCRMRSNKRPEFCSVCQRAIRRLVEFYTK